MPYKAGKLKGELTAGEIRKLVRGHNKLVSLKIPSGLDRDGLIKFLKRNKYEVDHKNQKLINKVPSRYTQVSLERAKRITKPKPRTGLQKQKATEAKAQREEKKKKEQREIRKKAVEEERKRNKTQPKKPEKKKPEKKPEKKEPEKKEPEKKEPEKKIGRPKGADLFHNLGLIG